jgi:[ribosomal protein S5]-alanine N-acetyltransferase
VIPEPLSVGDISLRPWREDEGDLYRSLRDEEVFRFTTESDEADAAHCGLVIAAARTDKRRAAFAVCDPNGDPVGNVSVRRTRDHVEVSYWLATAARGRGWASDSLRAVTAWVRSVWGEIEVWLEIDPANQASIRVAEAAGFRRGGIRLESACGGPALVYRRPAG